jgi:steroid 5-alpha reductase family enzyme
VIELPLLLALGALLIMAVVMTVSWLVQRRLNNAGWTDVFWTLGTGLCGVVAALWPDVYAHPPRQWLVAALVAIWSLRLGLYVAFRVARSEDEDPRYARMRKQYGDRFQAVMFKLSIVQPPATALLIISIALAAHDWTPVLWVADYVGAAILIVAIGGETLADHQMKTFKATKPPKGKVIDVGLWRWSRHPNYFFEWFGWLAYPVIAMHLNKPWSWASMIAPVVMYQVLNKLTGIPPTEAALVASKGDAYRDYQRRVSPFFPMPPKARQSEAKS